MAQLAVCGGHPLRTKPWPLWPQWDDTERRRLMEVLEGGVWGGYAPQVAEFEREFARLAGARFCMAGSNGTVTMIAALRALGVRPGDEVIVPAYTFIATALAVSWAGATPVFVDITPDTYTLDPDACERALSPRTTAVIPVHFGGHPADLDRLLTWARASGLAVLEDAAQAHGATWNGRPVGAIADGGSFSFQSSKNLNSGEGGCLVTNREDMNELFWRELNVGRRRGGAWYEHPQVGTNGRLGAWQAAVILAQMTRFEEQMERRMASAQRLTGLLAEIEGVEPLRWDQRAERHAFHLYIMRYRPDAFAGLSRDEFVRALSAEGVPCSVGYPYPLHMQTAFDASNSRTEPCPASEEACRNTVWLTQNLLLADPPEMDDIAAAIRKIQANAGELIGRLS